MNSERWRHVSRLFHEAVALPVSERPAYLKQACQADESLRSEVESLLEQALAGTAATTPAMPTHVDVLHTGRRLGTYQLQERIGAGGMGEVYRAHDTRLGRDVAIKVLPRAFTADPDRLARFAREARVLAALNHPNIATIHGFEDAGDVHGLVMELVDGNTLADLIRRGPLSAADSVAIALQIVDALGASHDKGIVHRDLKPANIKITSTGSVKLLDFGLARVAAEPAADLTETPTITGTYDGLIIGTAPYMSPEQARGQAVDRRTDIWAFGCVLFEMLSGRAAFSASTVPDILAAVLGRDPDWNALPAATDPALIRLMRRCLHKDPRRRLRDISDSRDDLEDSTRAPARLTAGAPPAREVEFRRITDFKGRKESPAVSPDGKMAAFVAVVGGRRQIWIRFLAGGSALQITRDDVDHEQPRWAPDSSRLIYYTPAPGGGDGTIWEISALGGSPRRVTTATGGGDVSRDGLRVAVLQAASGGVALVTMARDGSQARRILFLPGGFTYTSPRWAPDGRLIAITHASNVAWEQCLDVVSVDDGERRGLVRNDWLRGFTWRPDGTGIVYSSSRGSTVRYPPTFNLRTVDRDGSGDRQLTFGDHSYVDPDAYAGTALLTARVTSQSDVWRMPIDGAPADNVRDAVRVTNQTAQVQTPSPSPDDKEVVYLSDSGGHGNLWIARTDGSDTRQLTFESDPDVAVGAPRWSPRGDVIVFIMSKGGQTDLWLVEPDGGGLARLVDRAWGPCWSGDGQWIYYTSLVVGADRVEKVHRTGAAGNRIVVRRELGSRQPAISADGEVLYYDTRVAESAFGHWGADHEIWCARPEDGPPAKIGSITAGRVPISPGMFHTVLSPDGRWLAIPLIAGATTNIWGVATDGSGMRPFTDFGDRSIIIARSVSWSCVSNSIYAAVAETETDIVMLDGAMSS